MVCSIPTINVGKPTRYQSLTLFPLFRDCDPGVDYRLAQAAIEDGTLLIEEINENGSVPELLVENKGDQRVLFIEGEELIGAKQNRILNTSVLVPAHRKIKIPVSCVEKGRWQYKTRYFQSGGSHSPSKLRSSLKSSVSRAVREKRGHRSDQGEVWRHVDELCASYQVASGTSAMSDATDALQDQIESFKENLAYIEGAYGMAIAIGERLVSVDVFDKEETCRQVWQRVLSGAVLDAIQAKPAEKPVTTKTVEQLVDDANKLQWEAAEAVGEGDEYRAQSERGAHASTLTYDATVVHGSIVAA